MEFILNQEGIGILKKYNIIYPITYFLVMCLFLFSPRFGWYMNDIYGNQRLYLASISTDNNIKTITYKNGDTNLVISDIRDSGYTFHYVNHLRSINEQWSRDGSFTKFTDESVRMPYSIYLIGIDLEKRDRNQFLIFILTLMQLSFFSSYLLCRNWKKAVKQNILLKRDLSFLFMLIFGIVFIVLGLRVFQ